MSRFRALGTALSGVKWTRPLAPKKKSAQLLRCRKIDLGKWASGVYKISSPILDPEVLEDLGAFGGGQSKTSDSHDD